VRKVESEDLSEADALPGAPHPRRATSLIGHKAAEQELLSAYREGRLAHAWLIGGREGIGKATLAWRFARFVLANPDPAAAAVREAGALAHSLFGTPLKNWTKGPTSSPVSVP